MTEIIQRFLRPFVFFGMWIFCLPFVAIALVCAAVPFVAAFPALACQWLMDLAEWEWRFLREMWAGTKFK